MCNCTSTTRTCERANQTALGSCCLEHLLEIRQRVLGVWKVPDDVEELVDACLTKRQQEAVAGTLQPLSEQLPSPSSFQQELHLREDAELKPLLHDDTYDLPHSNQHHLFTRPTRSPTSSRDKSQNHENQHKVRSHLGLLQDVLTIPRTVGSLFILFVVVVFSFFVPLLLGSFVAAAFAVGGYRP